MNIQSLSLSPFLPSSFFLSLCPSSVLSPFLPYFYCSYFPSSSVSSSNRQCLVYYIPDEIKFLSRHHIIESIIKFYHTRHKNFCCRNAWVVQLVKRLTLDFGSGHDLTICEFEPHIGFQVTVWSLLGILSLSPSLSLLLSLSLSLSLSFS